MVDNSHQCSLTLVAEPQPERLLAGTNLPQNSNVGASLPARLSQVTHQAHSAACDGPSLPSQAVSSLPALKNPNKTDVVYLEFLGRSENQYEPPLLANIAP